MKLSKKKIKSILGSGTFHGSNYYTKCPKCNHNEFGISMKKYHKFGCFRKKKCGFSGNIFTLLNFLNIQLGEGEYQQDSNNIFNSKLSSIGQEGNDFEFSKEVDPPIGWKRLLSDSYLQDERFITEYQMKKHRFGRGVLNKDYVTILIEMEGRVRGYVSRYTGNGNKSKYDNSKGVNFQKLLFGYDEIIPEQTKTVILVEGVFDKTKTDINLCLDESSQIKCCATFGGHISDDQITLLKIKGVENIILLFESDIMKVILKASSKLGSKFKNVKIGTLPKEKDPNNLLDWELIGIIENLVDYVEYKYKALI